MVRVKLKTVKQKRVLAITAVAVAVVAIGATIAYNMDSISFANLFHTKASEEEYVETFESPDNWQPCEEIPKTAIATNRNDTVRYARMKYDEYWRLAQSQVVDPDDHTTTELPLTWNDNGVTKSYAVVNLQNTNNWELREDGWYYYKLPLAKDQSTLSLLRSVTLNCDAKLVQDGTASATATGQTAESVPTAYADATYHLYVTMQLSDVEWPIVPHTADCQGNLLYDAVACQTNGIDDGSDEHQNNVNFTTAASTGTNGFGVNTLAAHAGDVYPTYYYRGAVDNNYVAWNNYCWKIIRTTETGGVKMIIVGQAANGANGPVCTNIDNASTFTNGTVVYSPDESSYKSLTEVGYMRGVPPVDSTDRYGITRSSSYSYYFANDISYDSSTSTYTLMDTIYGPYDDMRLQAAERHHYTCLNQQTTCGPNDAVYIYSFAPTGSWLKLNTAEDIEDLKDKMFTNTAPSVAKSAMEGWFGYNLASKENELEDTIFCNDREIAYGALISKDTPALTNYNTSVSGDIWGKAVYSSVYFAPYKRNSITVNGNLHPSVDCSNKRDSFTKTETATGNGKLAYMVGLITLDEMTLAGSIANSSSSASYLNFGNNTGDYWTMSPSFVDTDSYYPYIPIAAAYSSGGPRYQYWGTTFGARPVVSLKKGTRYTVGGDGTVNNPYVIQ